MKLEGGKALITGASSGIGAEFARQLHAAGCDVVLTARRGELLQALADKLNFARPGSARVLSADLTSAAGRDAVVALIDAEPFDIVINNAGRGSFGEFDTLEIDDELRMVALNVTAPLAIAHAAVTGMKARRNGALIAVSSIAGIQPLPYMATYSATKAFNLVHSLALRAELARFGVKVLAVCPGPVETEFAGVAHVPGTVTGGARDTVESTVAAAIRALASSRPYTVPGLRAKALAALTRVVPVAWSTALLERMLGRALELSRKGR